MLDHCDVTAERNGRIDGNVGPTRRLFDKRIKPDICVMNIEKSNLHNLHSAEVTAGHNDDGELGSLMAGADVGLALFDPELRLLVCNQLYRDLCGYRPADVTTGTLLPDPMPGFTPSWSCEISTTGRWYCSTSLPATIPITPACQP